MSAVADPRDPRVAAVVAKADSASRYSIFTNKRWWPSRSAKAPGGQRWICDVDDVDDVNIRERAGPGGAK